MSERVDITLDGITGASDRPPISADDPDYDLVAGEGLLVAGRGEVLMGHPTEFDRAG